jgi:hypothetical protein
MASQAVGPSLLAIAKQQQPAQIQDNRENHPADIGRSISHEDNKVGRG